MDEQIASLEVSLHDNEAWHYCVLLWKRGPVRGLALCNGGRLWRRCALHPRFHQMSFSRGKGWFLNSSKWIHAVHLPGRDYEGCGLNGKWVTEEYCCLFNNPSRHGNCRADESVKWLQGLSVTKLISTGNAPLHIRLYFTSIAVLIPTAELFIPK